jgi:hypothetical protein
MAMHIKVTVQVECRLYLESHTEWSYTQSLLRLGSVYIDVGLVTFHISEVVSQLVYPE